MKSTTDAVGEVKDLISREQTTTERILDDVVKQEKKFAKALLILPVAILWEHPLIYLHRWYLSVRHRGLKSELSRLGQRLSRLLTAHSELQKGNYGPAISFLDAIMEKIPAIIPFAPSTTEFDSPSDPFSETPNPYFLDVLRLRNYLVDLQLARGGRI